MVRSLWDKVGRGLITILMFSARPTATLGTLPTWYDARMSPNPYADAAQAVITELTSRKGFDALWDELDTDIQDDIRDAIEGKLRATFEEFGIEHRPASEGT